MSPPFHPLLYSLLLFLGMLVMLEVGRLLARRRREGPDGLNTIEAAVFALFGLLIAFTFSGAAARFQEKRMLVADEAGAIRTAYLRVDLAAREQQTALRELFRQYLDSRLETYRKLPDYKAASAERSRAKQIQAQRWSASVAAGKTRAPVTFLLLPTLNDMFHIAETRTMELQNHPPPVVYALLFGLGLLCSVLAGFRIGFGPKRDWLHILTFAAFTTVIIYTMLDVEYPRVGLIQLKDADRALVELRASME